MSLTAKINNALRGRKIEFQMTTNINYYIPRIPKFVCDTYSVKTNYYYVFNYICFILVFSSLKFQFYTVIPY